MNKDLVSVIIPTYKRALKCKAAVESVLSQTHAHVEVVVVDDGSKDNTREVISGLDKRIKYVHKTNAGVTAARNTGLEAATGDYVAFLDDDDIWFPWKLEAQLSVLRKYPKVGMVWTDMRAVSPDGTLMYDSYLKHMYHAYRYFDRERHFSVKLFLKDTWEQCPEGLKAARVYMGNIFSWMFMGNLVHTSTVLLRKSWQEAIGGFDEDLLKSGEDYDFHFRTCRLGDVAYIDASSIDYRVGAPDQLTAPEYMIWGAQNNLTTVLKMLARAEHEIQLPKTLMRKRMSGAYGWVGMMKFHLDHGDARSYLWASVKYDPLQVMIPSFLFLSFMPKSVFLSLFKMKRSLKGLLSR